MTEKHEETMPMSSHFQIKLDLFPFQDYFAKTYHGNYDNMILEI